MVREKEQIVYLWFKMWILQQDLGMDDIFAEDVIYTESWGPKYNNCQRVKHGFMNGTHAAGWSNGILSSFFIKITRRL